MIVSFRHKGLKRLYEKADRRLIQPDYADKVERILARLDEATVTDDMSLPGFRMHQLTGDFAKFRSVKVSGNWRIIFRFGEGHAFDVDLIDYH